MHKVMIVVRAYADDTIYRTRRIVEARVLECGELLGLGWKYYDVLHEYRVVRIPLTSMAYIGSLPEVSYIYPC